MGDYYTLRFSAPLNDFGIGIVHKMLNPPGARWEDLPEHPLAAEFAETWDRAGFIPYGGLAYEPDGWEEQVRRITDENVWQNTCSVKLWASSRDMILYFFRRILPPMLRAPATGLLYSEYEEGTLTRIDASVHGDVTELKLEAGEDASWPFRPWYVETSKNVLGW